jgi:DNA repair exonuclease SbcCD ATPase subunit
MNVQSIQLAGFTSFQATARLNLPERGVVLITGANGAGKSSTVEGVAWALWGKTLRGADPTHGDELCLVRLTLAPGLLVERARKNAKTVLSWEGGPEYENATKAQAALERTVGSFDVWRRACVFSSADAAHFTLATDAERKRLLETVLGLDRFDGALDACRADLRGATTKQEAARRQAEVLQARHQEAEKRAADAREVFNAVRPTVKVDAEKTAGLRRMLDAAQRESSALIDKRRQLDRAGGEQEANARNAQARLAKLGEGAECPSCGQKVPEAKRAKLRAEVSEWVEQAQSVKAAAREEMTHIEAALSELDEEHDALRAKMRVQEEAAAIAAATMRQVSQAADQLARAAAEVEKLAADVVDAVAKAEQASGEVMVLLACERVLGLKGVRAHVLAGALSGLEAAANAWLSRVAAPGLRLKLNPYTEKKTGGMADSLSLDVIGAGGGRGYKGASAGERRRIDLALMLALADVAGAAHGVHAGTMFFDEVADALDGDGQVAAAEALRDLAADRCVVVISHSDQLAWALQPAMRVRVEAGCFVVG